LFVDDPMCEYSHIGVLERCDRLPALHALGEHREDLSRELLDFGIGWPRSNVHPSRISMKSYDREYFRRWYQDPDTRVASREGVARKVHLAVSAAEFMLARPIESVLDIGCGEGPWRAPLLKLRPRATWVGVDSSEYVVAKYGKSRSIVRGEFGSLQRLKLRGGFDLIVCADVVQYVSDEDLRRGLREIRRLARGVAYVETFAAEDSMEGDRDGWIDRPARKIREFFRDAGLTHCGFYCWIDERKIRNANRLEVSERT
jgi:SAM-dependent methyltransferase